MEKVNVEGIEEVREGAGEEKENKEVPPKGAPAREVSELTENKEVGTGGPEERGSPASDVTAEEGMVGEERRANSATVKGFFLGG